MKPADKELAFAGHFAFAVTALVVAALVTLLLMPRITKIIAAPSLKIEQLQKHVTIEVLPPPEIRPDQRVEHTVEGSEFVIPPAEVPVEPPPEVVAEPEPPKPVVKPRIVPKPVVRTPKTRPVPVKKSVPEPVPEVAPSNAESVPASVAAAPVASSPGNSAKDAEEMALAQIVRTIEANKKYPRRARQTGIEGSVTLAVTIDATGTVTDVSVAQKAPSVLLNKAALEAAKKTLGLSFAGMGSKTVRVPVVFTLTR